MSAEPHMLRFIWEEYVDTLRDEDRVVAWCGGIGITILFCIIAAIPVMLLVGGVLEVWERVS